MTSSAQRAALEAIHSARPLVARLGESKNSEDLAADLIEAWSAVENGLRSLIGGSAQGGQALIRELRQRHFLSLEQANALAEFNAARERAGSTSYTPTQSDVNAARDAFLKLEAGLMSSATVGVAAESAPPTAPPGRTTVPMSAQAPVLAAPPPPTARRRPEWLTPLVVTLGVLLVIGIVWYALAARGSSGSYDQGVMAYREGRREAAAGAFIKATKDDPTNPMPHVYLARMAREAGRLSTANDEAVTAVKLGPGNVAALRELASVEFAQQNYDGARTFFARALKADPRDLPSQGYLGCSLIRLGRVDEGAKWVQRAGSGPWTGCLPPPSPTTAPTGAVAPAQQQPYVR